MKYIIYITNMTYSLTGSTASNTYGRLVQVVDGNYYDGFGNSLDISMSQNIDGGAAYTVYAPEQNVDGGGA